MTGPVSLYLKKVLFSSEAVLMKRRYRFGAHRKLTFLFGTWYKEWVFLQLNDLIIYSSKERQWKENWDRGRSHWRMSLRIWEYMLLLKKTTSVLLLRAEWSTIRLTTAPAIEERKVGRRPFTGTFYTKKYAYLNW
jgi:hypothetical protein